MRGGRTNEDAPSRSAGPSQGELHPVMPLAPASSAAGSDSISASFASASGADRILRPRCPRNGERCLCTCSARAAVPSEWRRHDDGLRRAERASGADVWSDHQCSRWPRDRSRTTNCWLDCDRRRLDHYLAGRSAGASRDRELQSRCRRNRVSGTSNARHAAALSERSQGHLACDFDCCGGASRRGDAGCWLGRDHRHCRRWSACRRLHRRSRMASQERELEAGGLDAGPGLSSGDLSSRFEDLVAHPHKPGRRGARRQAATEVRRGGIHAKAHVRCRCAYGCGRCGRRVLGLVAECEAQEARSGSGVAGTSLWAPARSTSRDFCPPAARHYAVDAHAEGNGSGAAGDAGFNRATSNTVRCVRVDGDTAAVGAVIGEVVPDSPFNAGDYILQYFVDRGTSSPDAQRDLVSAVYVFPPTFAWPEGFPDVCPPANGTSDFPPVYLELTGGDMTVQDAPSD